MIKGFGSGSGRPKTRGSGGSGFGSGTLGLYVPWNQRCKKFGRWLRMANVSLKNATGSDKCVPGIPGQLLSRE
jgi:hypothetical protein